MRGIMADTTSSHEFPRDIMNDPEFNPPDDDGMNDADTCRICRGEAAENEPLFYPCKCSGSIKFVHQDCLMEWLSHSQKKHCELCKTPFRFTKLYSPHMPQQLPASVFLRHLAVNLVRNITTWLRLGLVVTVWLGILPFAIRQFWRFIFWFSDGGWPSNYLSMSAAHNVTTERALEIAQELQMATMSGNGTSPATPFLASQTSSASLGALMEKITGFLIPFSQSLNISAADPLMAGFMKSFYYGFGFQSAVPDSQFNTTLVLQFLKNLSPTTPRASLLSEVSFLKNMTRSQTVNSIAITITEGYIITFLVVISFILVFLIREWVVQQQPGINMGAGFNAEFAGAERRRNREPRIVPAANIPNIEAAPVEEGRGVEQRDIIRPRRRIRGADQQPGIGGNGWPALNRERPLPVQHLPTEADADAGPGEPSVSNRPTLPGRDALDPAADLQRRLTEEPKMTREFLNIWQRADADPAEVLRIIEQENLSEQMAYWVSAMKILQIPDGGLLHESRGSSNLRSRSARSPSPDSGWSVQGNSSVSENRLSVGSEEDKNSSGSWIDVLESSDAVQRSAIDQYQNTTSLADSSRRDKGKGKEEQQEISSTIPPAISTLDNRFPSHQHDATKPFDSPEHPITTEHKENLYPQSKWSFSNLPTPEANLWSEEKTKNIHHDSSAGNEDQAWKDGQTIRVQKAIAKGREAQRESIQRSGSTWGTSDWTSESDRAEADLVTPSTTPGERYAAAEPRPHQTETSDLIQVEREDGSEAVAQTWDEIFENNPIPESESSNEVLAENHTEVDHVIDVGQAPHAEEAMQPAAAVRPVEPPGIIGQIADWLWARPGIELRHEEPEGDDEQIVQDIAAEAPFVHRGVGQQDLFNEPDPQPNDPDFLNQDREVVAAALAAGLDPNDPDGIDDAEDFDGIMELVGMRGPLPGLLQNALFSAFLLALAVAIGVWIPYNIGRVALLLTANPGPAFKLPLRLVFGCAAFLQDAALACLGFMVYIVVYLSYLPFKIIFYFTDSAGKPMVEDFIGLGTKALDIASTAFNHGMHGTMNGVVNVLDSDLLAFSAASHESLLTLKTAMTVSVAEIGSNVRFVFTGDYHLTVWGVLYSFKDVLIASWQFVVRLPELLLRPESWVISLEVAKRATPLDPALSVWDSWDRFWATFSGYTTLCVLGVLYVNKGSPFSEGQVGREWEATIIDLLHQAGGVMKVILIISIEMLAFPLYCGLLLDAALLPLFENATIMSRILFTLRSPLTSIFVHWFVGTCYMFHFALFVSMCRKIMRKGVLYFIRDPDDPTFHPVRDVLERNVATQLRKILFSALVYGALVVICLGGVVWGLTFTFKGVLPIHWSSNEPVLEFPIDLLFYNFLMPLAVRFFKPSDGLHTMYSWWFRRCARMLRLTWFMFDERRRDEEGRYIDQSWSQIIGQTAEDWFSKQPVEVNPAAEDFVRDGRYVRTPASDQVRIPKDRRVFLEVTETNDRIDGGDEGPEDALHSRENVQFKQVYVPPYFRLRIFLFIFSIWLFAAVTGVGITIVPLVFGRQVFARLIPAHVRKNDVYAFSIGIYILGTLLYTVLHLHQFAKYIRRAVAVDGSTPQHLLNRLGAISTQVGRIAWTYAAFLFLLPTLSALLVEFYLLIPMHTYFASDEPHVVHFVQSWTLGLLYVKLSTRLILWYEDSRPAQALRAITRDGYLNPDARLATRSFILPVTVVLGILLSVPWAIAMVACKTIFKEASAKEVKVIFRYVYPMMFAVALAGLACWALVGVVRGWKQRIKDEVYLIGERLHNFGDNRKVTNAVTIPGVRRIET